MRILVEQTSRNTRFLCVQCLIGTFGGNSYLHVLGIVARRSRRSAQHGIAPDGLPWELLTLRGAALSWGRATPATPTCSTTNGLGKRGGERSRADARGVSVSMRSPAKVE